MTLVCRNCSRVNPPEAQYCYWDGVVLDGQRPGVVVRSPSAPSRSRSRSSSPRAGSAAISTSWCWLVTANGKKRWICCAKGYLEGFFGGMGRADLALAAKQSIKAADPDRGLDQLLSKLPCSNREPPKLFAQPLEVNLGQMSRSGGSAIRAEHRESGHGPAARHDRLRRHGLADARRGHRLAAQGIPVFARLQAAGAGPRQGTASGQQAGGRTRLTIESNGGATVIVVRADVPVQPFPEGALAGAISPRQVAEKAKANPKTAAPYFEKGVVAAWYESNGWIYPVQGPASSGLGAIQQFFEALGLVKAPVVEISETAIHLHGPIGASLEHVLHVRALGEASGVRLRHHRHALAATSAASFSKGERRAFR